MFQLQGPLLTVYSGLKCPVPLTAMLPLESQYQVYAHSSDCSEPLRHQTLSPSLLLNLPQSPEVLLPLLGSTCSPVEVDDRRYVFQCVRGAKTVVLQAMSEKDRDEVSVTSESH